MQYSAILFDLDGTLIDSLPGIEYAVDHALASMNLPARDRSLKKMIGPPIRKIFSQLVDNLTEEQLAGLEKSFRLCYDGGAWRRTVPYSGALSTIRVLHEAGIPLFVVTNKPALPTRGILEEFGLISCFAALVSRDSKTPPYSSKLEMVRGVITEHRLDPDTCLYVGDTLEDYEAGAAAGISVALVPHGYGSLEIRGLPASSLPLLNLTDLLQSAERVEIL